MKTIELVLDLELLSFVLNNVEKQGDKYSYSYTPYKKARKSITVEFPINQGYEVFDFLEDSVGNFNTMPTVEKLKFACQKLKKNHNAELVALSHNSLQFQLIKELNNQETDDLITNLALFCPGIVDIYKNKESLKKELIKTGKFVLWWD